MALLYALVLRLLHALLALKAKLQRGLARWDSLGLAWKRRRPRRAFAGGRGRGKGVGGVDDGDACDDDDEEEEEGRRGLEMARHDGRALRKLPVHVGLVLSEAAGAERGFRDVANAVLWCVALGVSYVSVFDARGMLKETNGRLMEEVLRQQREQLGSDWSKRKVEFVDDQSAEALLQGTPATVRVALLSPRDGGDDGGDDVDGAGDVVDVVVVVCVATVRVALLSPRGDDGGDDGDDGVVDVVVVVCVATVTMLMVMMVVMMLLMLLLLCA
ncbi:dehydrodolichyl diphosphate synthase complex subunit NUS1 isoform X2 [Lampetra planeri]